MIDHMGSGVMSGHVLVLIELEDEYGRSLDRSVPVEVEYVKEIDQTYGADADGRRGVRSVTVSIIDLYINPAVLKTLNSAQVEDVLARAKQRIEREREP